MGQGSNSVWDASGYSNSTSNFQQRDAAKLMEQIEKDGTNNIEVIVDIGCGPGNTTQQMSKRIPHKKIYAFDLDPQMISYTHFHSNLSAHKSSQDKLVVDKIAKAQTARRFEIGAIYTSADLTSERGIAESLDERRFEIGAIYTSADLTSERGIAGGLVSDAEKKHKDDTIEYFVQDIGIPWEKLDERLRALEGKVDLIWSNFVLHWVKDKATVSKTMVRLLKPGGRCYVNTIIFRDPFQYSEENKRKYERFYKVTSLENQLLLYKSDFENSGLHDVNIELLELGSTFDSEKQFQQMMCFVEDYFATLLTPPADCPAEEIKKVVKKMGEVGTHLFNFPYRTNTNNQAPENKLRVYYEQARITGRKEMKNY